MTESVVKAGVRGDMEEGGLCPSIAQAFPPWLPSRQRGWDVGSGFPFCLQDSQKDPWGAGVSTPASSLSLPCSCDLGGNHSNFWVSVSQTCLYYSVEVPQINRTDDRIFIDREKEIYERNQLT